ncbi:C4-dicarboxylate ABC transporter [Shewanella sp. MBTL60-007]|nr:C4-dicarboxylate ABC transporter [Shewanella sp. MBTL60-007]
MALAILAGGLALWNYQKITLALANQFLIPYKTQVHQLSFRPSSLTKWHISAAELTVDNSDIKISDADIVLAQDARPWAFKVNDLQGIRVANINVNLAPSALTLSSQNTNENGPTIGLNFGAFPGIDLKQIQIRIKGADSLSPEIKLNNLSLNKLGELTSEIKLNELTLVSLSAKLQSKQWQANTYVDLSLLQSFSRQLAAAEQSLQTKKQAASPALQEQSLLAPLYQLTQAIDDRHIQLDGKLNSALSLNLKNAQLSSKHSLQDTKITFNDFAKQTLQPVSLVGGTSQTQAPEANLSNTAKSLGRLDFEINGPIVDPKLILKPFELSFDLENNLANSNLLSSSADEKSNAQLQRLLQHLQDQPFEQALFNLYQQLRPDTKQAKVTERSPNLLIGLNKGLNYQITQQKLHVPRLSLQIEDSNLDAKLIFDDFNYHAPHNEGATSDTGNYQFSANWVIEAKHNQALTLNNLWPKLAELPYLIEFDSAAVNLNGQISASHNPQQTNFAVVIASGANQVSKGIKLKSAIKPEPQSLPRDKPSTNQTASLVNQTQQSTAQIKSTKLTLTSTAEYRYQQNYFQPNNGKPKKDQSQTRIIIPSLHYDIDTLEGHFPLNNALEENYRLKLEQMGLALQHAVSLKFSSGANTTNTKVTEDNTNSSAAGTETADSDLELDSSFAFKLLSHTLANQIDISVTQLSLDKSGYNRAAHSNSHQDRLSAGKHKRRHIKQKLAHFDTIELSQKLNLNRQGLQSDESWKINNLYLTSQHQFTPKPKNLSQFRLIGDWQFKSEFAPILEFLSQTDSLPESLDIEGNTELAMHYQLEKSQGLAFDLTLDPQVSDIQGSLNNLPFGGGNMNTQCHFNWLQDSSNRRESAFNCDNIKLSLQAFNPGVLITDIDAEAAVSFAAETQAAGSQGTGSQVSTQDSKEQDLNNIADNAAEPSEKPSKENLALALQLLGVKQASVGLTARGDLLGGQLLIPQFQLNLTKPSSAYFVLQHIDLEQLLAIQPQVGIYADGIFDGVLPVIIEQGKASVSGGKLAARAPGGLIAISNNPAVAQMRQSQPYLEFAFSALEHLNYSELSSSFDMDAQGDAKLKVNVKGRSRGIERPIHFNYSQEENMLQLLRSLQIGDNLQDQIERAVK